MEGELLLGVGAVLLLAVTGAFLAQRSGVPLLVAFLGLGMLLGSEGPGGIDFDDPELARAVGVVGLAAILFEGGLTTAWRGLRPVIAPAFMLGTLGVAVTSLVTGGAAYLLFDVSAATALLVGAVCGSTDAAAVFATLRFTALRRRLARLLEAESGLNDPTAVALTLGLIAWVTEDHYGVGDFALLLVQQLAVGAVVGLGLGYAASHAFRRFPASVDAFAPVASVGTAAVAFGAADVLGGSGFLSVYLVGLLLGNTHVPFRRTIVAFHQGLAFLAQVVLFVVLGLLVFPSGLDDVAFSALALTAVLVLVARPLAVVMSTVFGRFSAREQLFLGWAGLRGAVPIVLATFVQSEHVSDSDTIFNAVFFVVLVSALVQGPTLEPLARRLRLATAATPLHRPPIDVGAPELDLLDFHVHEGDVVAGRAVRDLRVPREALLAVVVRDGDSVPPRGSTVIEPGDVMWVITRPEVRERVEDLFDSWRNDRA